MISLEIIKKDSKSKEIFKRNQIYKKLNYLFSGTSPFDFFSDDTMTILKMSNTFSLKTGDTNIKNSHLLKGFLFSNTLLAFFLRDLLHIKKKSFSRLQTWIYHKIFYINLLRYKISKKVINGSELYYNKIIKTTINAKTSFASIVIFPSVLFGSLMRFSNRNFPIFLWKKCNSLNKWEMLFFRLNRNIFLINNPFKKMNLRSYSIFTFFFLRTFEKTPFHLIKKDISEKYTLFYRKRFISNLNNFNFRKNFIQNLYRNILESNSRKYSN